MATALAELGKETLSTTARQFLHAVFLALAAVALGCLLCLGEKLLAGSGPRFAESPAEVMMRAFGLAHFLVGWLFLFTSPRLRQPAALARLGVFTVLGILLCVGFGLGGGRKNPLLLMLFYSYFLIHEVRDEANLYQANGDGPPATPENQRFFHRLSAAVALLLIALLAAVFLMHGNAADRADRLPLSLAASAGVVSLLFLGSVGLGFQALRLGVQLHGDLRGLFAAHRPLFQVLGGLIALLAVGSAFGTTGLHLVILVHVCAWMTFVRRQLGKGAMPTGVNAWTWLRQTPTGFVTLHLALVVALLVLMALRVHVWERSGWLSAALATSSFPYWGLMHISMAWWGGK